VDMCDCSNLIYIAYSTGMVENISDVVMESRDLEWIDAFLWDEAARR
jgi:hypothetical protein